MFPPLLWDYCFELEPLRYTKREPIEKLKWTGTENAEHCSPPFSTEICFRKQDTFTNLFPFLIFPQVYLISLAYLLLKVSKQVLWHQIKSLKYLGQIPTYLLPMPDLNTQEVNTKLHLGDLYKGHSFESIIN